MDAGVLRGLHQVAVHRPVEDDGEHSRLEALDGNLQLGGRDLSEDVELLIQDVRAASADEVVEHLRELLFLISSQVLRGGRGPSLLRALDALHTLGCPLRDSLLDAFRASFRPVAPVWPAPATLNLGHSLLERDAGPDSLV